MISVEAHVNLYLSKEAEQAFARAINPRVQAQEAWSFRMSTPGLLSHAVKTYGWSFIPNHVLPPMLANIG